MDNSLSDAFNKISQVRCLCVCSEVKEKFIELATNRNLREAMLYIVNYHGPICGAVETMKQIAWEALENDSKV